ncbi:MAG: tyrosine-type recombinase/integrase [Candidatus Acidiferrales bacterium]
MLSLQTLEFEDKIDRDARKTGRANGKDKMARRRYQLGCLFVRGKRPKVWVARWRERVLNSNGGMSTLLRSEVLGAVKELTRRQAQNLLEDRLRPFNTGRLAPRSVITFRRFVEGEFIPLVLPTMKFATQEIYSLLLRKHLLPRFGEECITEITTPEVQRFVLEKMKQGYAWETASHMRHLLSKVLGTAKQWRYVADNPVLGVEMPERKLKRPHTALSIEEIRMLLSKMNEPERTITVIATLAGLRIGEILGLRWGRIHLDRCTLEVEEICYKGVFGTPKSKASRRKAPLAPAVVQALDAHRLRSMDTSVGALVFSKVDGDPLSADNLRKKKLASACRRAGVRRIDWHTLRHTYSTLLHDLGTPIKVQQTLLGHSSAATTMDVYTHPVSESERDAVSRLGDVLFPTVPNLHQYAAGREIGSGVTH